MFALIRMSVQTLESRVTAELGYSYSSPYTSMAIQSTENIQMQDRFISYIGS